MNLSTTRWASLLALTSLMVACSDSVTAPSDASTADGGVDVATVDVVDAGAPTDRPVTDIPTTDVGMDVPGDIGNDTGTDAGSDVRADAGSSCATAVEGAACSMEGQSCGGPCADPCQFCNILRCEGGRWTRLEIFPMPCIDGGADAGADVAVGSQARMLWQSPGGFAGTGPAVMVDGDGTVRIWDSTHGVDLASPSAPTRTLTVTPSAAAALFTRWASVDRTGLPHAGGSADCYGRASYRACADASCRVETVMFNTAAQITPEMNPVRQWFDDNIIGEMTAAYPRSYCSF